eukprot:CAMPEP_0206452650 /NCGR_PEP_ID=MMETSP0324_2-20121206/20078_1 /ASSEMBLY_ACC=CAM_ASM_000836 /TAXON_ID=2866 /ORGANISM="Crypthecodinium cohnii, Strain Seligo" /LENGTH=362 /DNA_ID=CAMNT_0053922793 /DNA_START=80 /DNA_END=1168 /DNA_ORIENTATION=-
MSSRNIELLSCFCCRAENDYDAKTLDHLETQTLLDPRRQLALKPQSNYCRCCCKCCAFWCCLNLIGVIALATSLYVCINQNNSEISPTAALGADAFQLQNMSIVPSGKWQQLHEGLTDPWEQDGFGFGYVAADRGASMLFEASKVLGVFEKVPEELRGVWWAKGSPFPQVLMTFNFGHWSEEEKTLLVPTAPWTTAWWSGGNFAYPESYFKPLARLFYTFVTGKQLATGYAALSNSSQTVSYTFSRCPGGGESCEQATSKYTFAEVSAHPKGHLQGQGFDPLASWSLMNIEATEVEDASQRDQSLFARRLNLECGPLAYMPEYHLAKIIDASGNPVEPFHSEYMDFMSGMPLIVWSKAPPEE